MPKQSAFVKGLIDKYKQAIRDERGLVERLHRAQKAFEENRETKRLCAALLRKENVDPDPIRISIESSTAQATVPAEVKGKDRGTAISPVAPASPALADASSNGQQSATIPGSEPINATHAVYLIMRGHGNVGFRPSELVALSAQGAKPLTSREVNKVLWTQLQKQRMERVGEGKFRLTPAGEAFTGFRKKADVEDLSVGG